MDNSLRLQLLRTKRELQTTINQIDTVLFYNTYINPSPLRSTSRSQASRQFVDGLMNILGNRYSNSTASTVLNNSRNQENNTTQQNIPPPPPPPPLFSNSTNQTTTNLQNNSSSSIFSNLVSPNQNIIPDLVEVTLYSQNRNTQQQNMEDVGVSPDINVLTNSSSIHLYRTLETEFEECSICRERFTENSIVRKINNCDHIFHINCIDTWLENNITCPICRTDLRDNTDSENV